MNDCNTVLYDIVLLIINIFFSSKDYSFSEIL